MEMKIEEAARLVEQLQYAHRISVAFYRRFLPLLDDLTAKLGCQFISWKPAETDLPSRKTTRPSSKWAWDFVPLFASNYVYWRTNGNNAHPDDVGISLWLYIDDSFMNQKRQQNNVKGQPDPVTLPIGNAVLQAYVFRPTKKSKNSYAKLWELTFEDPEIGLSEFQILNDNMKGIAFEWPLADVISNRQSLIDTLLVHVS